MGGGQANSGQASTAAAQQTAANNQDMALSKQYGGQEQQIFNTLFGSGGKGGTLSGMMNPANLTQTNFNPAYQAQWNQAQNNIAQNYSQQKGSLAQSWANSGMSGNNTPSGFQANQMRQLANSEADTRGATYAGLKGQQYSDALNNFWNASNIAAGQQGSATSGSTTGSGNAGSSSSAIYGTAGQYHPNQMLQTVGQIGAAAAGGATSHCPRKGSRILMLDGEEKAIEKLEPGDVIAGGDGKACVVESSNAYSENMLRIVTSDDCVLDVSPSHALMTPDGGFVIAFESVGAKVVTEHGVAKILGLTFLARGEVYDILTDGSHSYRANGIWGWGVRDDKSDKYLEQPDVYAKLLRMAE